MMPSMLVPVLFASPNAPRLYFLLQSKKRLLRDHQVKKRLDIVVSNSKRLLDLYKDADGLMKKELQSLTGTNEDAFKVFMRQVDKIRRSYSQHPDSITYTFENPSDRVADSIDALSLDDVFTANEKAGRVMDFNHFYQQFLNLSVFRQFSEHYGIDRFDYLAFLSNFDDLLTLIPYKTKATASATAMAEYKLFVSSVVDALRVFFTKAHPLVPPAELDAEIDATFDRLWQDRDLKGYFPGAQAVHREPKEYGLALSLEHSATDAAFLQSNPPSSFDSSSGSGSGNGEAPAEAGSGAAAESGSLYCAPCQKLFTKQTLFDAHLPGKKHQKNLKKAEAEAPAPAAPADTSSTTPAPAPARGDLFSALRELAHLEFSLEHWADLCRAHITHTRTVTDKLLTKSLAEILAEEEADDDEEVEVIEEAAPGAIYNPKNVPLGWDGKPIPLWMYKLHGFQHEYACEICGGDVHRGERNFIKHFREWKHTHMLKCLGITNSQHFVNVITVKEAVSLDERLKREAITKEFQAQDEEVEDAMGNVWRREDYEQHKRAGAL
jgi:splicing factor 3A subunit 3